MGHFRFWRRIKIFPGVYLNFSKSGLSVSAGPRGAKLTLGKRGTRTTVGIPGTGLSYTRHASKKADGKAREKSTDEDTDSTDSPTRKKDNG